MPPEDLKTSIVQKITLLFSDDEYTFDAFILMKGSYALKRFVLFEGSPEHRNDIEVNFKKKLQNTISEVIIAKFAGDAVEYDSAEYIADNQGKFYVIPQTDEYRPFATLDALTEDIESYRVADRENAEGIFFRYQRGGQTIWAFQFFGQTPFLTGEVLDFTSFLRTMYLQNCKSQLSW